MIRALTLALLLAGSAAAQEMTPSDTARVNRLDHWFGLAMRQALAGGAPQDLATLAEIMAGDPLPPDRVTLAGDWTCRTVKIGGLVPLTVYGEFRCRIERDGAGWRLEKLTGSQRTRGTIRVDGDRLVYVGVGHVADTPPPPYAALAGGVPPDLQGRVYPQVGIVEQISADRARLLLPAPILESRFDILYLTR